MNQKQQAFYFLDTKSNYSVGKSLKLKSGGEKQELEFTRTV